MSPALLGLLKQSRSTDDLAARMAWAKGGKAPVASRLGRAWLMRRFPAAAKVRILFAYQEHRLALPQVYPFLRYSARFAALGIHFRALPTAGLTPDRLPANLDALFLQSRYVPDDGELEALLASLKKARPNLRIVYLDWFAPTDIRLAERVEAWTDAYVKKSLLRDRDAYAVPTTGHTNLTDHYSARFGTDNPPRSWQTPVTIIPKLDLSPAFSTAPELIAWFEGDAPAEGQRDIDLHARIATRGCPWYTSMRQDAKTAVTANFADLTVVMDGRVAHAAFMAELMRSKLCFSPFGYGEVCWRDFEAIAAGSVLVKPDMSQISADPNIYIPDETYVPVAWDFSDLDTTVRALLADPARRRRIAERAFAVVHDHLHGPALQDMIDRLMASRDPGPASS